MKENDYFLNYIDNPSFSPTDFAQVGLNVDNTSIEKKDTYKNLESIKSNPLFLTDGKFDEAKFDIAYNNALVGFNGMADIQNAKDIAKQASFYKHDIFAPLESRGKDIGEFIIHREHNADRLLKSFQSFNQLSEPNWSMRELGQTQQVWDEKTKSWQDSPNDSFFGNFFETRVLAQWDEDGEHEDPITGQIVQHKKGDKKLNANGTYYYENLNGRDIYGRDVLSKFDTLTTDGSFANKFDFFDSDDKEKSLGGSLMRNVVKIAPMLIPPIAPWYAGARVILNVAEIMPKVGKMFMGSDSPALSALEGFANSFDFSSSDYAQNHPWAMENILNLTSDVFTLLAEQRWIFLTAPSLLHANKLGFNKEAQEAFIKAASEKNAASMMSKLENAMNSGVLTQAQKIEKALELQTTRNIMAQTELESVLKGYNKLGEHLSKTYMTAVTVADSYAEAKEQGLSDTEAALFTLGYAAGEYGILNTGIGEWILPELRLEKAKMRQVIKSLASENRPSNIAPKTEKLSWYKKLFDTAKNFCEGEYATGKATIQHLAANALGEGVEEVSEEVLADFSKSLFNASAWLRGDDSRLEAWDNMETRYGLSFVGGAIGGGLGLALPSYKQARQMKDLSKEGAFLELVHMVREGQTDELLKVADSLTLGDKNKSAIKDVAEIDGTMNYQQYDASDSSDKNWDQVLKDSFRQLVKFVKDVLSAKGANISDNRFLDEMTLKELRFAELRNSSVAASYLQDFNTIAGKIVDLSDKIYKIEHPTDTDKDKRIELTEAQQTELANLRAQLTTVIKLKDMYLDGTMAKEYIADALFEMSEDIAGAYVPANFIRYVEAVEKKNINEISEPRLKELKIDWDAFVGSKNKADRVRFARKIFTTINERISDGIKNHDINYFKNSDLIGDILDFFITKDQNAAEFGKRGLEQIVVDADNSERTLLLATNVLDMNGAVNPALSRNRFATLSLMRALGKITEMENLNRVFGIPLLAKTDEIGIGALDYLESSENIKKLLDAAEVTTIEELTPEKIEKGKKKLITQAISNFLYNNADEISNLFKNQKFAKYSIRKFFNDYFIEFLGNGISSNFIEAEFDEESGTPIYENDVEAQEKIRNAKLRTRTLRESLDNLKYSPIDELLDQFQIAAKTKSRKISELLESLHNILNSARTKNDLSIFSYDADTVEEINQALELINLFKSHINAARHDGVSLTNIFGYNTTMNELNPESQLAEINVNTANVLLQDLAKVETELKYYKSIFNANSGQKLNEHKSIGIKNWCLKFKKIKTIFTVPDDILGTDDESNLLKSAILAATNTDTFSESDNLNASKEQQLDLQKELLRVETALGNWLRKNIDKLDKVINAKNFSNLLNQNDGVVNKDQIEIDDSAFIWYLATITAIDARLFYKNYNAAIVDSLAPVPGQEQAVQFAYAYAVNPQIFEKFAKEYNNSVKELVENIGDDTAIMNAANNLGLGFSRKEVLLNSDVAINNLHHCLVEGIPGAGKSTGFYGTLIKMINENYPELLQNLWIVHLTADDAKSLLTNLTKITGIEDLDKKVKCFGKEDYLKLITGNKYTQSFTENGAVDLDIAQLDKDPDTNIYKYKYEIDRSVAKPSLVFIDEATHMCQLDLMLSEDFLNISKASAICTGDFTQNGAFGAVERKEDGVSGTETFGLHRNNFMRCQKLGQSMRTECGIKDVNIYQVREASPKFIKFFTNMSGSAALPEKIKINYAVDEQGIYGDKIINNTNYNSEAELPKDDINLMLKTLQDNEVLHYITDKPGESNVLYSYLRKLNESGEFKGKIDFIKGSAQGKEGQYYIVDINTSPNTVNGKRFVDNLYTAISRSKQGTLMLTGNSDVASVFSQIFDVQQTSNPGKAPLSEKAVKDYGTQRKEILTLSVEDIENQKYIGWGKPEKKETTEEENTEGGTEGGTEGENPVTKDENPVTEEPVVSVTEGENPVTKDENPVTEEPVVSVTEGEEGTEDEAAASSHEDADEFNKEKPIDINNEDESILNMQLHGFNTDELGFEGERGSLKAGPHMDLRIDGLNGLVNAGFVEINSDGTLKEENKAIKLLTQLRNSIYYAKDEAEYIDSLIGYMEEGGVDLSGKDIKISFAFKCTQIKPDSPKIIAKNKWNGRWMSDFDKEYVQNLFGTINAKTKRPRNKKIVALISIDGKTTLEIPVATFTSPITLMHTKGFEDILARFKSLTVPREKRFSALLTSLQSNPCKNSTKFLKLCDLYKLNKDLIVPLKSFNPFDSSKVKRVGLQAIVDEKGSDAYEFDADYRYLGDWRSINELKIPGRLISKRVYAAKTDYDKNGISLIAGHAFILMTDDPNLQGKNDEELFKLFMDPTVNTNQSKIKRIYVSTPGVTIKQFFENYCLLFQKNVESKTDKFDPEIGNILTNLRILKIITSPSSRYTKHMEEWIRTLPDATKTICENEWKCVSSLVQKLSEIKDSRIVADILNSNLGDKPEYSALFDSMEHKPTGKIRKILQRFTGAWVLSENPVIAKAERHKKDTYTTTNPEVVNKLNLIEQDLNDTSLNSRPWHEGIFYRLTLDKSTSGANISEGGITFIPCNVNSDYQLEKEGIKLDLKVNGKVDPASFVTDVMPSIDEILDGIDTTKQRIFRSEYNNHVISEPGDARDIKLNEVKKEVFEGTEPKLKLGDKVEIYNTTTGTPTYLYSMTLIDVVYPDGASEPNIVFKKEDGSEISLTVSEFKNYKERTILRKPGSHEKPAHIKTIDKMFDVSTPKQATLIDKIKKAYEVNPSFDNSETGVINMCTNLGFMVMTLPTGKSIIFEYSLTEDQVLSRNDDGSYEVREDDKVLYKYLPDVTTKVFIRELIKSDKSTETEENIINIDEVNQIFNERMPIIDTSGENIENHDEIIWEPLFNSDYNTFNDSGYNDFIVDVFGINPVPESIIKDNKKRNEYIIDELLKIIDTWDSEEEKDLIKKYFESWKKNEDSHKKNEDDMCEVRIESSAPF